jgi:hypothetical protein
MAGSGTVRRPGNRPSQNRHVLSRVTHSGSFITSQAKMLARRVRETSNSGFSTWSRKERRLSGSRITRARPPFNNPGPTATAGRHQWKSSNEGSNRIPACSHCSSNASKSETSGRIASSSHSAGRPRPSASTNQRTTLETLARQAAQISGNPCAPRGPELLMLLTARPPAGRDAEVPAIVHPRVVNARNHVGWRPWPSAAVRIASSSSCVRRIGFAFMLEASMALRHNPGIWAA